MQQLSQRISREFQHAYAHFNKWLLGGGLPECNIKLGQISDRPGDFCRGRFLDAGNSAREIVLNPFHFACNGDEGVLSVLCHEMVHHWQLHYGEVGRRGYHNRAWADKMIEIGLVPSRTDQRGGRQTGGNVKHIIVEGGEFDVSCADLLASGFRLSCVHKPNLPEVAGPRATKTGKGISPIRDPRQYTCPRCGFQALGGTDGWLICGGCLSAMVGA